MIVQGAQGVEADHPASVPRRRTLHYDTLEMTSQVQSKR